MVKAYDGREPYIFISYSHKDSAKVLPCIEALCRRGFRVWYDNGIEAGSEWPEYIAERLDCCEAVIAFMSQNAQDSHNCRREIHFAIELKKQLLVVYLEDFELSLGMRLQLGTLQALFKHKSASDEEFYDRLSRATLLEPCLDSSFAAKKPEPPAPPAPSAPPVPEDNVASADSNNEDKAFEEIVNEVFSTPAEIKKESTSKAETKTPPKKEKSRREVLLDACEACNKVINANNRSFVFKSYSELREKQIKNACRAFGNGVTQRDIVALLDDTIMGSGKSGLLLTEDRIISRQWLFPFILNLNGIVSCSVSKDSYVDLAYTNGSVESYYFGLNRDAFLAFFKAYIEGIN